MVVNSAEIRWFFPIATPEIPVQNLDWFNSNYEVKDDNGENIILLESEETRDDYYLFFPNCDSVGVKLREIPEKKKENFEIKALLGTPKPIKVNQNVTGKTDQWIKWSSSNINLPNIKNEINPSDEKWIKVTKKRFLRKFSIDTGKIQEVWSKTKPFPINGCNVELTSIKIEAEPQYWFSLCFEAFGSPINIHSTLITTVDFFFQEFGDFPEKLSIFNSLNYPTWLINQ